MRLLHLIVVAALVSAAVYVYKIKFDSTLQAERIAKLTTDLRRMHDANASLRAEWSQLDNPARIQGLADRHLKLRPIEATQFDALDHLPDRAAPAATAEAPDPIATMIETQAADYPTGSARKPVAAR
jgi:cell division protein FtsL